MSLKWQLRSSYLSSNCHELACHLVAAFETFSFSHHRTPKEPEAPDETKRKPISQHVGTKMIAIDGPDIDVEPRALGELPPPPLRNPRKPQPIGPHGSGTSAKSARGPQPILVKSQPHTQSRDPQRLELPAVGAPKSSQQREPLGTRASSHRSRREQGLPAARAYGSKNVQWQRPPAAKASSSRNLQGRRSKERTGRRDAITGTPWRFGLQYWAGERQTECYCWPGGTPCCWL